MPTDRELYFEYRSKYEHLPLRQAAQSLATSYALSVDSVAGRLSRSDTVDNRIAYLQGLTNVSTPPSVTLQEGVFTRSADRFSQVLSSASKAAFISDVHLPYTRWDAMALTLQLLEDFAPDITTVDNDLIDYDGYSLHFEDTRPVRDRLFSQDEYNIRKLEEEYYALMPGVLTSVLGNHDTRWAYFKRTKDPESAELAILRYLMWREERGVLQFSSTKENALRLAPDLVFWHGQFASKNPTANARNTLTQFMENGQASTVVVGHTHRPVHIPGDAVGYPGVSFYNSGCLSRLTDVPYMKRDPKGWGLGIVLAEFNPKSRGSECHLVLFNPKGNKLTAQFRGRKYETELTE